MPVELPQRFKRQMDRPLGTNSTVFVGIMIGLAAALLLSFFVDLGAALS